MTQGVQKFVVNLGLGIQLIALPSRFRSLVNYLESLRSQVRGVFCFY